jgi:hypothetical protein
MVAQVIRQDDGSYEYVEVTAPKQKILPITDFEAYEGAKKGGEDLISAPSITEQTEKIQREIPGQVEFDATTGQFITKKPTAKYLEYKEPERTPESTELTALQKVMSMQPMAGTGDIGLERAYSLIEQQQKLAAQKQKFEQYTSLARTGLQVYNIASGNDISVMQLPIKSKVSQIAGPKLGKSTLGGVAGAGAAAYALGTALKIKEKKGMAAGASIGMAVGGPIGAVVGGVAGGILEAISVICTELNRQGLISDEDYKIHWDYTINKWDKDALKGYWVWAMPTAKKMKTNKLLTKFWHHIMKYKIQYIKYNLGKAKFTLKGYIYNLLVEQISLLISKFIPKKKTKEVLA